MELTVNSRFLEEWGRVGRDPSIQNLQKAGLKDRFPVLEGWDKANFLFHDRSANTLVLLLIERQAYLNNYEEFTLPVKEDFTSGRTEKIGRVTYKKNLLNWQARSELAPAKMGKLYRLI